MDATLGLLRIKKAADQAGASCFGEPAQFSASHTLSLDGRGILVAVQVIATVRSVESQFIKCCPCAHPGVSAFLCCALHVNDDVGGAVRLAGEGIIAKTDDVGRVINMEMASVEIPYSCIIRKDNGNFAPGILWVQAMSLGH